ncbi:glycosyltransferase [Ruegeria atlantica]|uniref:Putative glycosyltransferase EpsH n=1 Tax=Ruegeria atlantica TaxID=81569 RepID=A0A0P1EIA2_9RHOB|nr:glycosyltransferase [Ruegeria atlantica]CUH49835.1 Putative glycosyltransferase EpsH [Ruegeria atlantica]
MPKISVVVVSYNHQHYILDCLRSIAAQNYPSLEVIFVDDGSTDNSTEIARSFSEIDLQVFSKQNGGPSDAINYGLERASGDICVLTSADDILLPGSLEERAHLLDHSEADIVCGLAQWIGADGEKLKPSDHPDLFPPFQMSSVDLFRKLYLKGNFICAPSIAMHSTTFKEIGEFDRDFFQLQDYDYWMRATCLGKTFHCIDSPVVGYRWHDKNLSTSNTDRAEIETTQVLEQVIGAASSDFLSEVLFGSDHAYFALELTQNELGALLMMKHTNQKVSIKGKDRIAEYLSSSARYDAFKQSILMYKN